MCIEIEAETIIANYLYYNPHKVLDVRTRNKIVSNVYKNSKSSMTIDSSGSSSVAAVECNPHLFSWEKRGSDTIKRAANSEKYYNENFLDLINYEFPEDILSALEQSCK